MEGPVLMSFIVGVLALAVYTPYLMAKGICIMEYGVFTMKDRIQCMIPIYNVSRAEKMYTGKFSKSGIFMMLFLLSVVARFVSIFVFTDVMIGHTVTMIVMLVTMVLAYISNVVLVFVILNDSGICSLFMKIFYALIFPLGQFYIGTHLPTVLKNRGNKVETFK